MPRGKAAPLPGAAPPARRGPKPGFKRQQQPAEQQVAAPAAAAAEAPPPAAEAPAPPAAQVPPASFDSLQRGRNIDRMPEAELRAYARQIGISPRDCDGLAVERLRQNCTAQLYELIDAL